MFFSNLCWYLLLIFNAEVYRPSLSPSLSLSLFFCDHNAFRWHRTAPHTFSLGIYMNPWCPHPDPVSTRSCFVPRNVIERLGYKLSSFTCTLPSDQIKVTQLLQSQLLSKLPEAVTERKKSSSSWTTTTLFCFQP